MRLEPQVPYGIKAAVTRTRSTAWLVRTRGAPDVSGTRIIMYHRVADDRDELAVHPARFREQMEFLALHGYTVLDVLEVARRLAAAQLPPRAIGLSFDDGFRDVADHALPVLEEYGFRATVFVATGVTSDRASFSWYREQPPVLGWSEICELDGDGTLRFEAHTVTHPNLPSLADEAARREVEASKSELEAQLGRDVRVFAYPSGLFGERDKLFVREAGYEFAVTCEPGVNTPASDPFALRRRQIDARDRLTDFRAKIGGGHDTPPPLRRVYRRLRYGVGSGRPRFASSLR
jgi:peptidoglycan/xylan/chitin deacetylase (PgdA/CDA1 family)